MEPNNVDKDSAILKNGVKKTELTGRARSNANLKPKKKGEAPARPGRPKGITFEETLRKHAELYPNVKFLEDIKRTYPQLRGIKLTARDIICLRALYDSMKGAHNFADLIIKRLEGLPRQSINITQNLGDKTYILSKDFLPAIDNGEK